MSISGKDLEAVIQKVKAFCTEEGFEFYNSSMRISQEKSECLFVLDNSLKRVYLVFTFYGGKIKMKQE